MSNRRVSPPTAGGTLRAEWGPPELFGLGLLDEVEGRPVAPEPREAGLDHQLANVSLASLCAESPAEQPAEGGGDAYGGGGGGVDAAHWRVLVSLPLTEQASLAGLLRRLLEPFDRG